MSLPYIPAWSEKKRPFTHPTIFKESLEMPRKIGLYVQQFQ
ncbi:hypothetical protein B8V81_1329 [Paenibacillus pasadenensis]|uniref:Uncharacterized protein n=1 Tax=Paenibacillus pasadenensis TaxID=217090 RepID=A0A2N5N9V8_9BACL|nr:hypothetical protein B8V81_1329 [Paenibacillus pasadenensis]